MPLLRRLPIPDFLETFNFSYGSSDVTDLTFYVPLFLPITTPIRLSYLGEFWLHMTPRQKLKNCPYQGSSYLLRIPRWGVFGYLIEFIELRVCNERTLKSPESILGNEMSSRKPRKYITGFIFIIINILYDPMAVFDEVQPPLIDPKIDERGWVHGVSDFTNL